MLSAVCPQVKGITAEYVSTLMKVMPDQCKLLRFDYGSPGVMGYYQAQLIDLIQYTDLRTEVFQNFREIGNAVLFCLLVEQALVSETCWTLFQTNTWS